MLSNVMKDLYLACNLNRFVNMNCTSVYSLYLNFFNGHFSVYIQCQQTPFKCVGFSTQGSCRCSLIINCMKEIA